MNDEESAINQVKAALRAAGITMSVGGCGCCDSPWVKVAVNGLVVLDDSDINFDMFEAEKAATTEQPSGDE